MTLLHPAWQFQSLSTVTMGDDDRQMKYIETGVGFTNKVAQRILENLDGEEREQQLDAMREVMRDYIK